MNYRLKTDFFKTLFLLMVFATHMTVEAATVDLATAPLVTSTNSIVKPNILFVLDNSGSMTWTFMPDRVSFDNDDSAYTGFRGDYGYLSSQCNGVYYDPTITYTPPINADKVSYTAASFTAAHDNGYDTSSTARNLDSQFIANRFEPEIANDTYNSYGSYKGTSIGPSGAVYYQYTGSVTDKNYASGSSFHNECNTAISNTVSGITTTLGTNSTLFLKRRLASARTTTITVSGAGTGTTTTGISVTEIRVNGTLITSAASTRANNISSSTLAANIATRINAAGYTATVSGSVVTITGPATATNYAPVITTTGSVGTIQFTTDVFPDTDATKLTNFANWYSFYRTRMLMMKTSAGLAFGAIGDRYRVGLMRISNSSTPLVSLNTFTGTHRTDWYTQFYGVVPNGGTPLREALSNAGLYYSGLLSGTTDPAEYSCQQNFTLLSTDGYWNGSDGFTLDGSTAVGNQDRLDPRPYNDGAVEITQYTNTYTRNNYDRVRDNCNSGRRIRTTPEVGTCVVANNTANCTPTNFGYDGTSPRTLSACTSSSAPSATTPVLTERTLNDGATSGGTSDTLADVAMYYYKTDLRTATLGNCGTVVSPATEGPLCENNVFKGGKDNNAQQHMTTFTLGLGANGKMKYSSTYDQDSSGDYVSVKLGLTASSTATPPRCSWQANGTTCNWPTPSSDAVENIDDMWHAAVNGRGSYFSAGNPDTLAVGLAGALAGINERRGSAAAAASSTLNPVAGNNKAFIASYTSSAWTGNLEARGINTDTGETSLNALWCVEDVTADSCATTPVAQLIGDTTIYNCELPSAGTCTQGVFGYSGNATSGSQFCKVPVAVACSGTMSTSRATPVVSKNSDLRTIKTSTFNSTLGKYELTNFDDAYAAANPGFFNATKLAGLNQWSSLDGVQKTNAVGANLLNYLRGQYAYEDRDTNDTEDRVFRRRSAVIGDTLESTPTFMGKPVFSYPYPGYSDFKTSQAAIAAVNDGTVYIGANDGMMHAFSATNGAERWAYVPSIVIPNMWKLADYNYATSHVNLVNGTPVVTDVCTANCNVASTAVWKTILVGGLNAGGRGYYALDVTNPNSPTLLWELTTTTGSGSVKDDDMGYSFGQPVVTRKSDGTWVVLVASGYNNTSPGDGKGYLYVLNAATGAIISKISTNVGDTTTPSGLAKIAGYNIEVGGNAVGYVYGGDLQGNIWRFDVNSSTAAAVGTGAVFKFATLYSDTAGTNPQPITTTPILGKIAGSRVIFVGTGKYLEVADLSNTQKQTIYAIKDDGSSSTLINPRTTLVQQTMTNNTDANNLDTRVVTTASPVNFFTGRGWFVDLPVTGERVNIEGKLNLGALQFPTTIPSTTACSPGGYSYNNFFDFATGASLGNGIVSTKYDSVIVGLHVLYVDGLPVSGVVTADNPTPVRERNLEIPPSEGRFTGKRTLWRELLE
jgi:type IV pilus assembly protein PilY1